MKPILVAFALTLLASGAALAMPNMLLPTLTYPDPAPVTQDCATPLSLTACK